MKMSKNNLTNIILEEISNVLQEQDRTAQNAQNELIIATAEQAAGFRFNATGRRETLAAVANGQNAKDFGMIIKANSEVAKRYRAPTKKTKRKRRGARRYSSRAIRNKARRQAKLIRIMNGDKGRKALSQKLGKNYTDEINLEDIQKSLSGIKDKDVLRYINKAKPGVYDANTYRAIVAFQKKFRSELEDKRLDGLMGPSTYGVLLSKDPQLQKKVTTKGLAITSKAGFGALDKIASAKPGPERFEMMKDLAQADPDQFKKYMDSVLENLRQVAKEKKQFQEKILNFMEKNPTYKSMNQKQKEGFIEAQKKEKANYDTKYANLQLLYMDLKKVPASLKKDIKRTEADFDNILKKNAAKLGFKNLNQVNMALSYMQKDPSLDVVDAMKKAGVTPSKNAADIINNFSG